MGRVHGSVKWFDPEKGWGFIRLDSGDEVFVHHSDIRGEGFRSLKDGAPVELEVEKADRGPRARNVVAVGSGDGAAGDAPAARGGEPRGEPAKERRSARRGRGARGGGAGTDRDGGDSPGRDATAATGTRPAKDAGAEERPRSLASQVRERLGNRYPFAR